MRTPSQTQKSLNPQVSFKKTARGNYYFTLVQIAPFVEAGLGEMRACVWLLLFWEEFTRRLSAGKAAAEMRRNAINQVEHVRKKSLHHGREFSSPLLLLWGIWKLSIIMPGRK